LMFPYLFSNHKTDRTFFEDRKNNLAKNEK